MTMAMGDKIYRALLRAALRERGEQFHRLAERSRAHNPETAQCLDAEAKELMRQARRGGVATSVMRPSDGSRMASRQLLKPWKQKLMKL